MYHGYYILCPQSCVVKVGYSKHPSRRLMNLQVGNPHELYLTRTIEFDSEKEAREWEANIHMEYEYFKCRGEWFKITEKFPDAMDMMIGHYTDRFYEEWHKRHSPRIMPRCVHEWACLKLPDLVKQIPHEGTHQFWHDYDFNLAQSFSYNCGECRTCRLGID